MINKNRVLQMKQRRQLPRRFSWVDHRLLRNGFIERCSNNDLALYLVLVTAADRNGMSFYSDRSLCRLLKLLPSELSCSRNHLQEYGMIVWESPFYQVLSLDEDDPCMPGSVSKPTMPVPATTAEISAIIKRFTPGE